MDKPTLREALEGDPRASMYFGEGVCRMLRALPEREQREIMLSQPPDEPPEEPSR